MRGIRMELVVLAMAVASWPALAGSAVIGSVAGSRNATLGGQTLVANTTVFSGDSLQVRDGVAVVAVGQGSRMVFGRQTEASFLRESDGVTVLLGQGNVSMYHPAASEGLRVKVGGISIEPAAGYKTLGEVAMLNGAVVVTTKEGALKVEQGGHAMNVSEGKSVTLNANPAPAPPDVSNAHISAATSLQVASVAAGGTSAVLSGIAISRANDAKTAANAANATAASAVSAGNAATAAANAATTAATNAANNANAVGCALNTFANNNSQPSPYTPPTGFSC
jgi:hypothetical protein